MRRPHEVEGVGEMVEVREADEVPRQVLVLGEVRLVDLEHLLQLLQALVHDLLVGRDAAHHRVDEALVHDGRQGWVVGVCVDFGPDVHHRRFFQVALAKQVDFVRLVFAEHVLRNCA